MILMRNLLISILFASLVFSAQAQNAATKNANDGPYLLYTGDSLILTTVHHGANTTTSRKAFPISAKSRLRVDVKFSDAPEKDFSVRLKPSLKNESPVSKQPKKMLVMSDIEGEFDALRSLLLANKVINPNYEWTFGDGHLVICGDLFDRGKDVPAVLWLLYKLEQDAKAKGGYVHTILGNHDVMNLTGDLRYVDKKYEKGAAAMGRDYMELYSEHTELGRWLRTKNLIEKIGDNLMLHAGVSSEINALGLGVAELNRLARPYIGWKNLKKTVADSTVLKIFGSNGLLWNRDYFKSPAVYVQVVDKTLAIHTVKRIIVGHTITATNIGFYYGGKVLGVDVNHHAGKHEAALFENGQWYKVDLSGAKQLLKF